MSYYWFNRQELLQKAKEIYHNRGGKEKPAEYYIANKDVIKEKTNNKYRSLSAEEKNKKECGKIGTKIRKKKSVKETKY